MAAFEEVKYKFTSLCKLFFLPVPRVVRARAGDPCDFTSVGEVRINRRAARGADPDYHARHLFGHWIGDLEQDDTYSDFAADLVAGLVLARLYNRRDEMRRRGVVDWEDIYGPTPTP